MSKELPPSRTAEQFVVRFPDGMRDRIAEAAKSSNRSMNAEIVARLEQSFAPAVAFGDAQLLMAKWNRDLADAALDNHSLKFALAEMAQRMKVLVLMYQLKEGEGEDLTEHTNAIGDALKLAGNVSEEAPAVLDNFKRTHERYLELARGTAMGKPALADGSGPKEPTPQTREEMRRGVEEAKAEYLALQKELDELPPLSDEAPAVERPKPKHRLDRLTKSKDAAK